MPDQLHMFDDELEYNAFVDKFKAKKTTDDCYTPENIYETVAEWVSREYDVPRERMLRPFWPGGDFEREQYPEGCCVVDNPPFSILTKIMKFYAAAKVRFFLFAPTLTLFTGRGAEACYIPCGISIAYANGASVNTSFVTNLDGALVRSCPALYKALERENKKNEKAGKKDLPKYTYPPHVLTAAAAYQYSHYGIEYRLERRDATFIRKLDAMRSAGKDSGIFGGAFMLSERAAAERAAAERAAAERAAAERAAATVWELSERERRIIRGLGQPGEARDLLDMAERPDE